MFLGIDVNVIIFLVGSYLCLFLMVIIPHAKIFEPRIPRAIDESLDRLETHQEAEKEDRDDDGEDDWGDWD